MKSPKVSRSKAGLGALALMALILLSTFLWINSVSSATGPTQWTLVASTAAVDESYQNVYDTNGPYMQFRSTNIGGLYARATVLCPKDDGNVFWNRMEVVFKDRDGTSTMYRVMVSLYRVKTEAPSLGVSTLIASFDSNSVGASTATASVQFGVKDFSTAWDWWNYAYYVQIYLYRGNSTYNPAIYSVRLVETIF